MRLYRGFCGATPVQFPSISELVAFASQSHDTVHYNPCINNYLPPEILGEIFIQYVLNDNSAFLSAFPRISAHPRARTSAITLCHTLARSHILYVKVLVISVCVIWSRVNSFHLVRLWLYHSGPGPLFLYLHQNPLHTDFMTIGNAKTRVTGSRFNA